MASYYVKKEDFKNAKEVFYKLLELYPNDNLVNEEMRKANELIIEKYEENFKKIKLVMMKKKNLLGVIFKMINLKKDWKQ